MKEEKNVFDLILIVLYVICEIIILFLVFGLINKSFTSSNESNDTLSTNVSNVIELPVTTNNVQTNKISANNNKVEVLDVILAKEHLTLKVGEQYSFGYSIIPKNSTNKNVTWSSSNNDIVSIDNNGNIKALKVGTSIITVKVSNDVSSSCTVVVKDNSEPVIDIKKSEEIVINSISLNKSNETIYVGNSLQLNVNFNPSNATNKNIKWTSSDDNIAVVNNNGLVTTKNTGNVTITAISNNGMYSVCKINVIAKAPSTIAVDSISLNKMNETIYVGNNLNLIATINPSNATNKNVTWSSSNTNVAIVDNNGNVTGKSVGTATITVKSNNGKTASMNISVLSSNVEVSNFI